jgi:hypothetical protein
MGGFMYVIYKYFTILSKRKGCWSILVSEDSPEINPLSLLKDAGFGVGTSYSNYSKPMMKQLQEKKTCYLQRNKDKNVNTFFKHL